MQVSTAHIFNYVKSLTVLYFRVILVISLSSSHVPTETQTDSFQATAITFT